MQPFRRYDDSGYHYGHNSQHGMPPAEFIDDEVESMRVVQSTGMLVSNGPLTSNPPMGVIEAERYIATLNQNNMQMVRPSEPSSPATRFPRAAHGRPAYMWMHHPPVSWKLYMYIFQLIISH